MSSVKLNPWAYPALASNRTMGLMWALIAAVAVAATFKSSEQFYSAFGYHGPIDLAFQMLIVAKVFKGLAILAPLTQLTQAWALRRMKRMRRLNGLEGRVRPTYRGAIYAGIALGAISEAIILMVPNP